MRGYVLVPLVLSGCTYILGDRESSPNVVDASMQHDSATMNASMQLDSYCVYVYGSGSAVNSTTNDVYGWRCIGTDLATHTIDMQDACRYQLDDINAVAQFGAVTEKYSWRCDHSDSGYTLAGTRGIELHSQCTTQYGNAATLVAVD